jgi:B9 domain-containing protein 1
MAETYMR